MRFALLVLSVAFLTSESLSQELSKEQLEPWSTLKRQVGLYFQRDWKEHAKYIHPKNVGWGDSLPSPIPFRDGEAKEYFEKVVDSADKVVAFHLVPVSVVVVGDVAIINAYIHVLTKPAGKSVEKVYRLHNTWKKEDGRWQLLATYNTSIPLKGFAD